MCAEDIREELKSSEDNLDLCSQLGAVLGMLGDCWYDLLSWPLPVPNVFTLRPRNKPGPVKIEQTDNS
jgi:hypothetical protein